MSSYVAVRLVLISPLNYWQISTPFWCNASLCMILAQACSTLVVLVSDTRRCQKFPVGWAIQSWGVCDQGLVVTNACYLSHDRGLWIRSLYDSWLARYCLSQNKRNFYFSLRVTNSTMKLVQTQKVEENFYLDYADQYVPLGISYWIEL